jgi:hypothetical protein
MRNLICALALLLALAPIATPAHAQTTDVSVAAQAALAWMRGQQGDDGGFPGFGPGDTADAVMALAAAGLDPNGEVKNGASPVSYLGNQAAGYAAGGVGAAAKLALAAVAAGKDPRSFGGLDLAAVVGRSYNAASGQYGADVTGHCLALLAARSMGAAAPPAALARLRGLQLPDGGWSFDGSAATGSDTNTSALCVQALVAQGDRAALPRALAYLRSQQNGDGGFPYSQTSQFGSDSDANSTAAAIQALAALGEDTGPAQQALLALQNPSGAFRYQAAAPDDNALATYQSVTGLLAKPLPVAIAAVPGAQDALAPAPAPTALPATGTPSATAPALLALALVLLACGALMHRRGAEAQSI